MTMEMQLEETTYKADSYDEGFDMEEITLNLSKEDLNKIKAGTFYNNYSSVEEFIIDIVLNEIESDKQRHLKSKQGSKIK